MAAVFTLFGAAIGTRPTSWPLMASLMVEPSGMTAMAAWNATWKARMAATLSAGT